MAKDKEYEVGANGVPKDPLRAIRMLDAICVAEPRTGACDKLAWFYEFGQVLPKDEANARALSTRSCAAGLTATCKKLETAEQSRANAPKIPPEVFAETACQASAACKQVAEDCAAGKPHQCLALGEVYWWGQLVPKSVPLALKVLGPTCDVDPFACNTVAQAYWDGNGLPRDPARALMLAKRECEVRINPVDSWDTLYAGRAVEACAMVGTFGDKAYAATHLTPACDASPTEASLLACVALAKYPETRSHGIEMLLTTCDGDGTYRNQACLQLRLGKDPAAGARGTARLRRLCDEKDQIACGFLKVQPNGH
jgi:hypothetical protein